MVQRLLALWCLGVGVASADEPLRDLGLTFDVGVPDVVHLGAVYRPLDPLRLTAAVGTNGFGAGGRFGVAVKIPWDVAPVLAVDIGHFLESDATWLAVELAGEGAAIPILERVGYTYASARAGLEFGNPKATLYLHLGMSGMVADVHGLQAWADKEAGEGVLTIDDARITAYYPSARIGFIVYFKKKGS